MKKSNNRIGSIAAIMAAMVLLFSCTKETNDPTGSETVQTRGAMTSITDRYQRNEINRAIQNMPGFAVYNNPTDQYIIFDFKQDEQKFNFSSGGSSFVFSSSSSIIFSTPGGGLEFVEGPDGGFYQVIGGSAGAGGGGGLITAGDIALNVNYVICFASGEGEDADFFGYGEGFPEFAGSVGIAGDFETLMNEPMDENANPSDFFQGFVAFYIFEGNPDGEYEVNDFLAAQSGDADLEGNALAYFISFQDGEAGIFFGVDGNVVFDGNQVGFEGTYWGLTDIDISFDGNDEPDDPDYVEAEGSGFLTCP